ncbi:hypothetical protein BGZ82_006159, partial [Podila clonocystis]
MRQVPTIQEQIFLDIHGFQGRLFKMAEVEGTHVCGVFAEDINIPTNAFELKHFMN